MTRNTDRNAHHTAPRQDLYKRITGQIVAAIEAGADRWKMRWHITEADCFAPMNAASKRPCCCVDVFSLRMAAEAMGYPTSLWATYNKWRDLGAQVRQREKSTLVVLWKITEGKESENEQENAAGGHATSGSSTEDNPCSTPPRLRTSHPLPCPSAPRPTARMSLAPITPPTSSVG